MSSPKFNMTTDIISTDIYKPETRPVTAVTQPWYFRAYKIAHNFYNLVRALEYLNVTVQNKTVVITHDVGTSVAFREDGNIDVLSQRNFVQQTRGLLHLNPVDINDDKYTTYEDITRAYPERFNQSN